MIREILTNIGIVHINAFYSIIYFLTNNFLFFIVVASIAYIIKLDLDYGNEDYVNDERTVI